MSGTVIAQLISLLSLIALQRWFYGPEEFGRFKLFFEFVTIFSSIASFKLENAIVIEQAPKIVKKLVGITTNLAAYSAIVSFLIFLVGAQYNNQLFNLNEDKINLLLIPIAVFTIGIFQVYTLYFTKIANFQAISKIKVFQSSITAGGQILSGIISSSYLGLIIGKVIGGIFSILFSIGIYRKIPLPLTSKNDVPNSVNLIKKHKDFILFTTPGVFISGIINFLSVYIFLNQFGDSIGGEIATAHHYLALIIAVFSTSFAQVFYSRIAQINSKQELQATYFYFLKRLSIISVVSMSLLYLIPNFLVLYIFSDKWSTLFSYIKIAMFWSFTMLVASSLSFIFIKTKKQHFTFILDILHLIMILGLIYFFNNTPTLVPFEALTYFTIIQIAFYIIALVTSIFAVITFKEEL